jgi:DNA-binding transcriptional LysR family regulator
LDPRNDGSHEYHPDRALDALARSNYLTRAAQCIGIRQVAMYHHLRNLQEYYGVKLPCRAGRSMEFTDRFLDRVPASMVIRFASSG